MIKRIWWYVRDLFVEANIMAQGWRMTIEGNAIAAMAEDEDKEKGQAE